MKRLLRPETRQMASDVGKLLGEKWEAHVGASAFPRPHRYRLCFAISRWPWDPFAEQSACLAVKRTGLPVLVLSDPGL
jgi:hypothetical protein